MSATDLIIDKATTAGYDALSAPVVAATKTFMLDALGTALSGTAQPLVPAVIRHACQWGTGGQARVWGSGEPLPAMSAAFVNAYQVHNQEYDCVHEPSVVHPMGVILATLLAHGEQNRNVSGKRLLNAISLAVDIATSIGVVSLAPLRFYRQGTCSALGAAAGLSSLMAFNRDTTLSAMGLGYSQLSGTMQAHAEASPMLPMQMGANARAVLTAVDLASAGIVGPKDFLEGKYGYYELFERDWDPEQLTSALSCDTRVLELSHKPYPSGRATHAAVDALVRLKDEHGFEADEISEVEILAPPLVLQLANRPLSADMTPNYARLCLPFVTATALINNAVEVQDFGPQALADPVRLKLGSKVRIVDDGNPDLSALAPQTINVTLDDGRRLSKKVASILGHPDHPLSREQHLDKFRRSCRSARQPLDADRIEQLIDTVDKLEQIDDISRLVDLLARGPDT